MPGVKGELKPFRITRDELIDLVDKLASKSEIENFSCDLERFSFRSLNIEDFKSSLKDLRLPSTVSNLNLWLWGKPNINFYCSKDSASYSISGADTLDQVTLIEQLIQNFFTKHAIFSLFSFERGWVLLPILFFAGVLELFFSIPTVLGIKLKIQVLHPSFHLFVGLLCLTLLGFMIWSYKTSNPPHYSFVHSVVYMDRKEKSNALVSLIFVIIVELIVSMVSELLT